MILTNLFIHTLATPSEKRAEEGDGDKKKNVTDVQLKYNIEKLGNYE